MTKQNRPSALWITWENQRRTNELAKALDAPLYKYISGRHYLVRILLLSARTILRLLCSRPKRVIVQNPSIMLATVVCMMRPLFRYKLIVDRHSNFRLEKMHIKSLKEKAFQILSRYTIRKAHLTIVTNEFLKNVLEDWGGRGFVLPDKIPSLTLAEKTALPGEKNIVFVCSFSGDEPVAEVVDAARMIDPSIVVHITGNYQKLEKRILEDAPPNVNFTGFLSEKDYQSLLCSCDAVMVLTTAEHFLLCGAYEAVSLGRPLILSNTETLRDYFTKGAVYTENRSRELAEAITAVIDRNEIFKKDVAELAAELRLSWQTRFEELQGTIASL